MNFLTSRKNASLFHIAESILLKKEKLLILSALVLSLVGVVVETLSIGLVLPFVAALTGDSSNELSPWIPGFLNGIGQDRLIRISMFAIFVLYLLKSCFVLWSQWVQSGIKLQISARLSQDLFASYLRKEYEFHTKTNTSIILRNCQNAAAIVAGAVEPLLTIISDVLVTVALMVLLIYVEPIGTLATIAMFSFYAIAFDRFTRQRIRIWGGLRQKHSGLLIKYQQQGLGAIKEIKVLGIEDAFLKNHQESLLTNARVTRRFALLNVVPRVSLEVVTIAGITILVLLFSARGDGFNSLLPVLGLFAVAALRVQPAIARTIANVNSIRFNRPIIDEISKDLDVARANEESVGPSIHFRHIIELRNVSFTYESNVHPVLRDLTFSIHQGEIVGISGPSGAGKTTLVDVLLGLIRPTTGMVYVDGVDISQNLQGWQRQVGFVPQSVYLIDDSIEANIALGVPRSEIDHDRVMAVLRDVDLSTFVENLPEGIKTKVGERGTRLSGGQLQRIGIARALYRSPGILFLDESTSALDSQTEESVMESIKTLVGRITLVVIAHRESTLQYCSRRLVIDSGELVGDYQTGESK